MPLSNEDEEWETQEIALAAYLALELDINPLFSWDGQSCYFVFERFDELLQEVVRFVGGDAIVEPKQFHMKVSSLKKEMFKANPNKRAGRRASA